jgi:hypothetical protein
MREFYVYLHCLPNGIPFYVGKGSGNRARSFIKNRNLHYRNTVKKYGTENIQVIILPCKSEEQAFDREKTYIASLKAQGVRLVNLTEGGDGPSGFSHNQITRAKISATHKGRKFSEEHRMKIGAALRGKKRPPRSAEWTQKLIAARAWYRITPETRAKLSQSSKGNKNALGLKRGPMPEEQRKKISVTKRNMKLPAWNKGER